MRNTRLQVIRNLSVSSLSALPIADCRLSTAVFLSRIVYCQLPTAFFLCLLGSALGQEWPQFRGPDGQGHAVGEGLPLRWSETENVRWKVAVPGLGWSSPVIGDSLVWMTTALDDGRSLRVIALNRDSGEMVREVEVFKVEQPRTIHQKNSHASPTPILEADRLYVHFGQNGTACLSTEGSVLWKTVLHYDPMHGPGGSPTLFEDLLLVSCDGIQEQFVAALDKETGKVRWKRDRDGGRHSYSTPLVVEVNGRPQLISPGGDKVVAYGPRTGEPIWSCRYDGYSLVPRPVAGHGLVFVCSGYNNPLLYAIRPDGRGDITDSHVAWTLKQGAPHNPSPIVVGDEIYVVSDNGVATCLDARTGQQHWRQRLGGAFSASPLATDGRIYFLNEEGETTVLSAGRKFQVLAKNKLDGRTLASFAVADRSLFLRTDRHVYRVQQGTEARNRE